MAVVNKVEQRGYLGRTEIIRFQILTYCFFKGVVLTEYELQCLALLAEQGETSLHLFCDYIRDQQLYASAQTVRNVINRFEKKGLVVKTGKKQKRLHIHPAMQLQTLGNILLDFRFAHIT